MKHFDLGLFKVVYIDDDKFNLALIKEFAKEIGINLLTFSNPKEGIEYVINNEVDLVFIDYMMPEIDGIEAIRIIRSKKDIPIVMITAIDEKDLKIKALEAGATDFMPKPVDFAEFKAKLINLLQLRYSKKLLENKNFILVETLKKIVEKLLEAEKETLMVLGKTAEYKDPDTGAHISRVAHYSKLIAKNLGESEEFQDLIFYSSPLHDIGKVGIPDSILLKPAKLTDEEFEIMKTHTLIGYNILKETKSKYLRYGAKIALTHHEKYDGNGYPYGLKKDEIPLCGKIVAVADVFDALTSKRPYKEPWKIEDAIEFLKSQKDKQFDSKVVDAFLMDVSKVLEIFEKFKEG